MRARSIKPGICDNELLGTADPFCTLLFERLWMMADREGRLEDRPLKIKAKAFPYREGLDIEHLLNWLHDHGFIQRYCVDGVRFVQVLKFLEHQKPHQNEKPSVIPPPNEPSVSSLGRSESTTKVPSEHNQGTKHLALTPSSLTPDSGLLTAGNAREGAWQRVREIYPAGTYRDADWMAAEHAFDRLIELGEAPDTLAAAVQAYRAQQAAKQAIGTQFVLSPSKFFADKRWRGPFPLPATKADTRLAANVSAAEEFMRRTEIAS